MEKDKRCEGESRPEPAYFHEVDIEDVVLAREVVHWCFLRRVWEVDVGG